MASVATARPEAHQRRPYLPSTTGFPCPLRGPPTYKSPINVLSFGGDCSARHRGCPGGLGPGFGLCPPMAGGSLRAGVAALGLSAQPWLGLQDAGCLRLRPPPSPSPAPLDWAQSVVYKHFLRTELFFPLNKALSITPIHKTD